MNRPEETLAKLAAGLRAGDVVARQRLRDELEVSLVPLVRCALRSGSGLPGVVHWVRRDPHVWAEVQRSRGAARPEENAPRIARLLCDKLLRRLRPEPTGRPAACETVLGR